MNRCCASHTSSTGAPNTVAAASLISPTINDWVKQSTNGKIPAIVDAPIGDDVVMYLINAIYFNGSWTTRFDKNLTKPDQFTTMRQYVVVQGDRKSNGTPRHRWLVLVGVAPR